MKAMTKLFKGCKAKPLPKGKILALELLWASELWEENTHGTTMVILQSSNIYLMSNPSSNMNRNPCGIVSFKIAKCSSNVTILHQSTNIAVKKKMISTQG